MDQCTVTIWTTRPMLGLIVISQARRTNRRLSALTDTGISAFPDHFWFTEDSLDSLVTSRLINEKREEKK